MQNIENIVLNDYGLFLGKKGVRFVVKKDKKQLLEASAEHLEQIIIATRGVSLSSDALELALRKQVDIVFLNYKGEPIGRFLPASLTGTILTRRMQFQAYEDHRGMLLAKNFVIGKIENQTCILRTLAKNRRGDLKKILLSYANKIKDLVNRVLALDGKTIDVIRPKLFPLEGEAGRIYWTGFKNIVPESFKFSGRIKRGATDLVNVFLNYGYGVLLSEVRKNLMLAGLDPYAGFLHTDRVGRPSLILDLMEEFRQQVVDRSVIRIFKSITKPAALIDRGLLSKDGRMLILDTLLKRLDTLVDFEERKLKLKDVILYQARKVARFLRGEIELYRPFIGT